MQPFLVVDNLTISYGGATRPALAHCSFTLNRGEKLALLGLNASGKTSLLLAIAGLLEFSGKIEIDGSAVEKKNLTAIREKLGFLFANPEDQLIIPNVVQDIAYTLISRGEEQQTAVAAAHELLEKFSLADIADHSPHQLSDGQKHRVALAGTIIHHPPLLLLDEPTSSLDTPGKAELFHLLQPLSSAMLVATHDFHFAQKLCSGFLYLEKGELTASGSDWKQIENRFLW